MVNNRGFTVIELILVIVILGILAAIVYPKYQALSSIRVSSAAQTIEADIRYAQSLAVSTPYNYSVVFDSGANSYSISRVDRSTGAVTSINHPFKAGTYAVNLGTDYPGVALGSSYTVTFDYLGSPVTGGGGSVTVSSGGYSKTITVQANTGRVTIS